MHIGHITDCIGSGVGVFDSFWLTLDNLATCDFSENVTSGLDTSLFRLDSNSFPIYLKPNIFLHTSCTCSYKLLHIHVLVQWSNFARVSQFFSHTVLCGSTWYPLSMQVPTRETRITHCNDWLKLSQTWWEHYDTNNSWEHYDTNRYAGFHFKKLYLKPNI